MRELNRRRVIDALRDLGVASRADIARRTGLSRSTVSSSSPSCARRAWWSTSARGGRRRPGAAGRPPMLDRTRPPGRRRDRHRLREAPPGGAVSRPRRTSSGPRLVARWRRATAPTRAMDTAARLVERCSTRPAIAAWSVLGVGLGLPGPIHPPSAASARRRSCRAGPACGWRRRWRTAWTARARGQRRQPGRARGALLGRGHGAADLVYLKVATGVGAGLVVGGKLFYGAGGTAGELGHATVDEDGPICRCGNRGCLETLAAGARDRRAPSPQPRARADHRGDRGARRWRAIPAAGGRCRTRAATSAMPG